MVYTPLIFVTNNCEALLSLETTATSAFDKGLRYCVGSICFYVAGLNHGASTSLIAHRISIQPENILRCRIPLACFCTDTAVL